MKHLILLVTVVFSFSCSSPFHKKETADSRDTVATKRITLLFAGDFMQHQKQIDAAATDSGYDYQDCFSQVKEEVSKADVAIGNLEVTLGGEPYGGYPGFSAPDEYMYAIKDAGFDVMTLANNHCLDRGRAGLERTIHVLDSLKVPHVGTYLNTEERESKNPLLIQKNGFRIALLNYTYGTNCLKVCKPNVVNYIDRNEILRDIKKARAKNPDVIIACMHWGTEYQSAPDAEQTDLANWLFAHGVNHVIGSHPHVVQPMEMRYDRINKQRHILVYSLGNYLSDMSEMKTDGGVMFKMEICKDTTVRVEKCGYSLVWTSRPKHSGEKNYKIIPASSPREELPFWAANRLKLFVKDSRMLFATHNKEIKEYAF
ncbi:CapA family protein [uncultured Bacteroides sp.]|uniref:CapA family protein n=1 Tax=uncultured Bacteroides sp. TaxID=162156 RepID=UPI002AAABAA7|nr:CapA family protein [uncultured Bacteroides sp.]